ncbi:NUDIX hydrolase [Janibacter melonis]|uniref:NUDIX hydrolase n=1 Tax=Janibacter melonis TaxID=262209 RepID=UPI0019199511|nr:NUDIX domain-containing protein [Janibacter melonis]
MADLATDLERVLRTWQAPDEEQEQLRRDYLEHLAAHPDAVLRDGPPEHFTVGVLVLDATHTSALLTLHGKAHRWFQLGGHLEPGDADVLAGALREAVEESGLPADQLTLHPEPVHLDRHELVGSFGRCREHLDVRYVAVAAQDAREIRSEESLDLAWWPVRAMPADSAGELDPLVAAALRRVG